MAANLIDPFDEEAATDPAGFSIDQSRPRIENEDGTFSTERTITVGFGDRYYNVPTIWDGKQRSNDDAIGRARQALQNGETFPNFASQSEAERAAVARSEAIGRVREGSSTRLRDPFDEQPEDLSKLGEFNAEFVSARKGELKFDAQAAKAALPIAIGFMLTPDEKGRADIIKNWLPEAEIETDAEGRTIVSYKGERGYINAPGFSQDDVTTFLSDVVKYSPAGRYAAGGKTLVSQLVRAGAAGATTSAASDAAAIPLGSEQGIDPVRAGIAGAASVTGQAIARPIEAGARFAANKLKGFFGTLVRAAGGSQAASNAAETAQRLGITEKLAGEMEAAAKQATDAGLTGAAAETTATNLALARRFNLPVTKGQATGEFEQQALEDSLRNADVTSGAGRIMREQADRTSRAIVGTEGQSGFGQLQTEILGGRPAQASAMDAGESIARRVAREATVAKKGVTAAYEKATEAAGAVTQNAYSKFLDDAVTGLREEFTYDPSLFKRTATVVELLAKQGVALGERIIKDQGLIPMARVQNLRKLMTRERTAAAKQGEASDEAALGYLKQQFDSWLDDAVGQGQVTGGKEVADLWKQARQLRARYSDLFGTPLKSNAGNSDIAAGRAVEDLVKSDVVNGRAVITRAVNDPAFAKRLLTIIGEGSDEHAALKQGALEVVFGPAVKSDGIALGRFISQHEQVFSRRVRQSMLAIFSVDERKAIREFTEVVRIYVPKPGTHNPSKTGYKVAQMMQQLLQKIGLASAMSGDFVTGAAAQALPRVTDAVSKGQAKAAVAGIKPRPRLTGPGAAIGAAMGQESQR